MLVQADSTQISVVAAAFVAANADFATGAASFEVASAIFLLLFGHFAAVREFPFGTGAAEGLLHQLLVNIVAELVPQFQG